MDANQAVGQIAVEHQIVKDVGRWSAELPDAEKAMLLAQLVVLLGQLEPGPTPTPLTDFAHTLLPLLQPSTDVHVQRNIAALLASLVGTDEDVWRQLVVEGNTLVPAAMELLRHASTPSPPAPGTGSDEASISGLGNSNDGGVNTATSINMLAVLTAAAQGGEEGAQSVVNAGVLPVVISILGQPSSPETLQEASVDLMCQLGTYDSCKSVMREEGCVTCVAECMGTTQNTEVRVRTLMCLGMLLPNSLEAQVQLAQCGPAVKALLTTMQQSQDMDITVLSRSLFTALAQSPACKPYVEAALRGTAAEASV